MITFKRDFESKFRLWHWLLVLCVGGLLVTGLLRTTYLNSGKNGKIIEKSLAEKNITVDAKTAKEVAVKIREPMWQWHNVFGFALLGVTLLGIYVRKTLPQTCPLKNVQCALKEKNSTTDGKALREFIVIKTVHIGFFILLSVMLLSGFMLYAKEELGLAKESIHTIKEIHEMGLWGVLVFVFAHISGVVRKEMTTEHGLVSSIIGGKG